MPLINAICQNCRLPFKANAYAVPRETICSFCSKRLFTPKVMMTLGVTKVDLASQGFSQDEIGTLMKLREWYQCGGSDRVEVMNYLMFLKFLVVSGRLES